MTGAANGREALSRVTGELADVIVMDLRMSVMSGEAFMEVLRSYPRWTMLPVIVLTALPDGEELDRVIRYGVARVLKKPIDFSALTEAVAECSAGAEG